MTKNSDNLVQLVENSIQRYNEDIGLKGTWTVLTNEFVLQSGKQNFPVYAVLNNNTAEVRFFSSKLLEILELGEVDDDNRVSE